MNAIEAKELLLPIPTDDFLDNEFSDEVSKCCAIGHLQRLKSDDPKDYSWDNCSDFVRHGEEVNIFCRGKVQTFLNSLKDLKKEEDSYLVIESGLSLINNNQLITSHYNQKTQKERVIALLDDMIEAGY